MPIPGPAPEAATPAAHPLRSDLIGFDSFGPSTTIIVIVLSVILPVGIFLGITNVRRGRKELLADLESLFSIRDSSGHSSVVASFELLKARYDTQLSAFDSFELLTQYLIPVSLFVILCLFGFTASLTPSIPDLAGVMHSPLVNPTGTLLGSLCYTFFGAYLWSVRHLTRRVANFDLSPISFFQAISHLLLAVFVSAVIWHVHLFWNLGTNLLVGVAFLIGWFPDLFFGALAAKFPLIALKRPSRETRMLREEIPLDTIYGIDPFIKLRLNEYEIMDVQNLATANPIKIFVETPYGLFEAIDWVAQAQLILAVGSANVVELRKHNIRTVFDLERGIRNPAVNARLLSVLSGGVASAVGPIELPTDAPLRATETRDDKGRYDRSRTSSERPLDLDDELSTYVSIIRDDPHVRRLRQIWDILNSRLNARFDSDVPVEGARSTPRSETP